MNNTGTYSLLKKVIIFLILIISTNTLLSLFYYKKVATKSPLNKTDIRYHKNISNTHTLFLGHSRVQLGINDSLFDHTFNYSSYGENNIYTYYKLQKILSNVNHQIETVIIPQGFGTFSSLNNPSIFDHTYWNQYLNYYELGTKHNELDKYISLLLQSKLFPYSRFIQKRMNQKMKIFNTKKASLHQLTTESSKIEYAYKAIKLNFTNRNCYDIISYEYLQKMLELCEINDIKVIGIKYPVTKYYYRAYNDYILENKWDTTEFYSLLKKHNVKLLDFENLYFDRDDLFRDTHHLNEKGRQEFSVIVKQTIETL